MPPSRAVIGGLLFAARDAVPRRQCSASSTPVIESRRKTRLRTLTQLKPDETERYDVLAAT
jgi:hypothetical protein